MRDDAPTRLTLWCEYLRYGFNAEDLKVKFVPPEFMRRCLLADDILVSKDLEERIAAAKRNGDEGEEYLAKLEKEMDSHEARTKLLKRWWEANETLIVCMYDEASHRCGLLVERKAPRTSRYYEGGQVVSKGLAKQVALLRKMLEEKADDADEVKVPRTNASVRGDTAELVAHYVEAEMRELLGEARGCVKWPDPDRLQKVRQWMKGLRNSLEVYRNK